MLIAAELDNIVVPSLSEIYLDQFFLESEALHNSTNMSAEESIYQKRNLRQYPWERRVLEYHGSVFFDYPNKPLFRDLNRLIEDLPIVKQSRVVLLMRQRQQSDYDFNWHFDKDDGMGFRICWGLDTNQVFLQFARLRDEYCEYSKNGKRVEPYMVESTVYDLRPKNTNTVLYINGDTWAHRVPIIGGMNRAVLLVRGQLLPHKFEYLQKLES